VKQPDAQMTNASVSTSSLGLMLDLGTAFRSSPLWQELAAIAFEGKPWPTSRAKRQHFVPRFLLAGFIARGKDRLVQLDLSSGRTVAVQPHLAASRRRFYDLPEAAAGERGDFEAWLALIESHSAGALSRLLDNPRELSHPDRATLSLFLALIDGRTPAGNARNVGLSTDIMRLLMTGALFSPRAFAEQQRRAGSERTDDELEESRMRMLQALRDGSLHFADPRMKGFEAAVRTSGTLAQDIFASVWMLLRVPDGASFVTSDQGLAMHDPAPPYPWSAQAWQSSSAVEVSVPLSRDWLLLIMPPDRDIRPAATFSRELAPDEVDELNLRTYGWASDYVFGPDQHTVTRLRSLARRHPARVVRPRPLRQVLMVPADPADDSLAQANAARGWPPQLQNAGDVCDYVVVGPGDDIVATAERLLRLAERRGAKGIRLQRSRRGATKR
jgi:hypothetical protein